MVIKEFLRWIGTAPVEQRADATGALARAWLHSKLDDEELGAAEAALTVMLDDPNPTVREAMALVFASEVTAPQHIVLSLAHDVHMVSVPILQGSPVLLESELVDLVATGDMMTQCAIAARRLPSAAVSAAIAEVGEQRACTVLIRNINAKATKNSLLRIAERFGDDPEIREGLLSQPGIPIEVRQLIVHKMSEELANLPALQFEALGGKGQHFAGEAKDRITIQLAAHATDIEIEALVEHLRQSGQLTTTLLLRALCSGNLFFIEVALASLSGLPALKVQAVLSHGSTGAVMAVLKKAALPESSYQAFGLAVEVFREVDVEDFEPTANPEFARRLISGVLARLRGSGEGAHNQLLGLLRRFEAEAARDAARFYVADELAA